MSQSELFEFVVTLILSPLAAWAVAKFIAYIDSKTKSEKADKYLVLANDAVSTAVQKIMQVYVDTLKKNGTWSQETAAEAFTMAKAEALTIMGGAVLQAMPDIVGDLDAWLSAKIEAATLKAKKGMT